MFETFWFLKVTRVVNLKLAFTNRFFFYNLIVTQVMQNPKHKLRQSSTIKNGEL